MTARENPKPTAIERATEDVARSIVIAIAAAYEKHRVRDQIGGEEKFRALIAGWLENQSLRDWHRRLSIPDPESEFQ